MFKNNPLNIVPIGKIRENFEKDQTEIKYTEESTNYSENEITIKNLNNQPITNIEKIKEKKNKNEILTEKPIYNIPIDLIKKNLYDKKDKKN